MASQYTRKKRTVSTPLEAEPTIQQRLAKLGVTFSEYCNSLIAHDCWAEKEHYLTGEATSGDRKDEVRLWKEIAANVGKPEKQGSYFEHRVEEYMRRKLAEDERKTA